MAIDPISMPNSAALNYGEDDVRHFSEGDAMDVPGLSNPTRQLAQRDVDLATKLNEVVADVNNKEQILQVPILRTVLPPDSEEVIQNVRIPPGFEARVLDAIVTSIPASSSAELDIYYASNSYGNSTGTQVVSTSTEFSGGTLFYSAGELIITLKNRGGSTLEMIGSVMLTMRPIGETSTFLLASAIPTVAGPPGPTGAQGPAGQTGNQGPAGTPGLVWYGVFNPLTTYPATAVVFYNGSSYKSVHDGNVGNIPTGTLSDPNWQFLAEQGNPGFIWMGLYNSANTYSIDQAVQYLGSSYVCIVNQSVAGRDPGHYPADWSLFAQAGENGFRYRGLWSYPPSDSIGTPYVQNDVVNVVLSGTSETYVEIGNPPSFPSVSPPSADWSLLFSSPVPAFAAYTTTGTLYAEANYISVITPQGGAYAQQTTVTQTFTTPGVGLTIQIHVASTFNLSPGPVSMILGGIGPTVVFTIISIDSPVLMTIQNNSSGQVGVIVGYTSTVFANGWGYSTQYPPMPILGYPGTAVVSLTEFDATDAASGQGMCFLKFSQYAAWGGSVTLVLPQTPQAGVNWQASDMAFGISNAGTTIVRNGTTQGITLTPVTNRITISTPGTNICNLYLSAVGIQSLF